MGERRAQAFEAQRYFSGAHDQRCAEPNTQRAAREHQQVLGEAALDEIVARGNNLTDSKKYASGYASGGVSYFYVVPPRNLFVVAKLSY